ncbi:rare lipoA domain protein [Bosea sp. RAC05]|nr:rare lipoA domain protein [Bosea sp. RAC05]
MAKGERLGGLLRDVHHPAAMIGAAVVDAHDDRAVVEHVGDAGIGRQRHRRMRGADAVAVIDLAIGRLAAVEGLAIPGGRADHGVPHRLVVGGVALAGDGIGLADHLAAATLRHLLPLGDDAGAGGAVFGLREGADLLRLATTRDLVVGAIGEEEAGERDAAEAQRAGGGAVRRGGARIGRGGKGVRCRRASASHHAVVPLSAPKTRQAGQTATAAKPEFSVNHVKGSLAPGDESRQR